MTRLLEPIAEAPIAGIHPESTGGASRPRRRRGPGRRGLGPRCAPGIAVLLACSAGCSVVNGYDNPEVLGEWKGVTQPENELFLGLEGDGEAEIYGLDDPTAFRDDSELTWEGRGEDRFELTLRCFQSTRECPPTTVLECERIGENSLVCATASTVYDGYVFDWTR